MLPTRAGVKPSVLVLPSQSGAPHLLAYLCAHFPYVSEATWRARLNSGDVVSERGELLHEHSPFVPNMRIYYYREVSVADEPRIPFEVTILHIDEHLMVIDKPHFLPVIPSGRHLHETVLTRLRLHPDVQHLDTDAITPIHRLDKDTAGVMLLSHNRATRSHYQQLFQAQAYAKVYEAVAPHPAHRVLPMERRSRIIDGPVFYTSCEVEGVVNAVTHIALESILSTQWALYRLTPTTGKKHQLRVHMHALGLPLRFDPLYPEILPLPDADTPPDYSRPLQLLARQIAFVDPITAQHRQFCSQAQLLLDGFCSAHSSTMQPE